MNSQRSRAIKASEIKTFIDYAESMIRQKEFAAIRRACRSFLEDAPMTRENRMIYFHLAVAADMEGIPQEALPIFAELKSKFPKYPPFHRSFLICARNLQELARHKSLSKRKDSAELLALYEALSQYYFVPHLLLVEAARIQYQNQTQGTAKEILKALLQLSPRDHDYLKSAVETSILTKDEEWLFDLDQQIEQLTIEQPYRLELYEIAQIIDTYRKESKLIQQ